MNKVSNFLLLLLASMSLVITAITQERNLLQVSVPKPEELPVWVRYCDLISNPEKYHEKLIATEAIKVFITEMTVDARDFLYNPKCDSGDKTSGIVFDLLTFPKMDSEVQKEEEAIISKAKSKGKTIARGRVLLTGRFYGEISSRYENYRLIVDRIERITEVPDDTPLPAAWKSISSPK